MDGVLLPQGLFAHQMFSDSVAFLEAVVTYTRSYTRKEGFIFTQSAIAEKHRGRQELEAADHIATALGRQREMDSGAQLASYSPRAPRPWNGAAHFQGAASHLSLI